MYNLQDVTILPQISDLRSRSDVTLNFDYDFHTGEKYWSKLTANPVIVSNLDTTGTIEVARSLYPFGIQVALHKYLSVDSLVEWFKKGESIYSWYSMGIKVDDLHKFEEVNSKIPITKVHIDVANGYMTRLHDFVKEFREKFPYKALMVGNICTPEPIEILAKAGASIVKVGIASGGLCDTKNKASVGVPQLSAILDCYQAAKENKVYLCSDGGVKRPADIANAIAGGSSVVMVGSLFCGYDECNEDNWEFEYEYYTKYWDGETNELCTMWTQYPNTPLFNYTGNKRRKRLLVYGMSSKIANEKYNGQMPVYKTSEGKEEWIPAKNQSVAELAHDINGSLTSTCTYTNFRRLQDLVGYQKLCYLRNN